MRHDLFCRLCYLAAWPAWFLASVCNRGEHSLDRVACWLEGRAELAEERVLIEAWSKDVEVPS